MVREIMNFWEMSLDFRFIKPLRFYTKPIHSAF